jgi:CRISPR/Cas system CSM-associated protein Csm3 (group 7 of RAMP superfamily)
MLIGYGDGQRSDADLMRWVDTDEPYIPASSLAGALGKFSEGNKTDEYLWGSRAASDSETISASHLHFSDCRLLSDQGPTRTTVRDGVAIDEESGTAAPGRKYDYEVLEPGHRFSFSLECTVRKGEEIEVIRERIERLAAIMVSDSFSVGKNANHGFGQLSWNDKPTIRVFDFAVEENRKAWFDHIDPSKTAEGFQEIDFSKHQVAVPWGIDVRCSLDSPLLIATYSEGNDETDKSHITSNGEAIIPAKSLRGSLRHRSKRILHALGADRTKTAQMIAELFGDEEDRGGRREALKGNLKINEAVMAGTRPVVQDRIRIDRFTGAVQDGAKFESEPIWPYEDAQVEFNLSLNDFKKQHEWQAGLLLHLIKDLGTKDLALGGEKNIGRGILQMQALRIKGASSEDVNWKMGTVPPEALRSEAERFQEALMTKVSAA